MNWTCKTWLWITLPPCLLVAFVKLSLAAAGGLPWWLS